MISDANEHYAPVLLLTEEKFYCPQSVSNRCLPTHPDYIRAHMAEDKTLRSDLYAFPAMPVLFLSDAPADYQE